MPPLPPWQPAGRGASSSSSSKKKGGGSAPAAAPEADSAKKAKPPSGKLSAPRVAARPTFPPPEDLVKGSRVEEVQDAAVFEGARPALSSAALARRSGRLAGWRHRQCRRRSPTAQPLAGARRRLPAPIPRAWPPPHANPPPPRPPDSIVLS